VSALILDFIHSQSVMCFPLSQKLDSIGLMVYGVEPDFCQG
jgi:hypothetical protein